MNSKTAHNMLCAMQRIHKFIAANPRCGMRQLCDHFEFKESSMRKYVGLLRDSGHVIKENGESKNGQAPGLYSVSRQAAPGAVPSVKNRRKLRDVETRLEIERRMVPAMQMGMRRDPLVEAMFGPAVHA